MGKKSKNKSASKSTNKEVRNLTKRVERFVDRHDVTYDDLAMAGVGVLATTLPGKKHKRVAKRATKSFDKLVDRGRRLAPDGLAPQPETADVEGSPASSAEKSSAASAEPVISYQSNGGGWYTIQVDGIEVDRVKGEGPAADRAGELLAKYAALEPSVQRASETALTHSGGGWYDVVVNGVPVDRMRGRDAVNERYGHLVQEE